MIKMPKDFSASKNEIDKAFLAQKKLYNRDVNSFAEMDILLDVVQKLSLAKDLETVMFIVRKAARKLVAADGATFVLRENAQCYYADEDAIAPLWKGKRFPMNDCISGWVMEHGQHAVIEDIYIDPRIPVDAYRTTFVKSLAMLPIRSKSPIGAIGVYWAENYIPSEEQINLLKALADSSSIAMENIYLHSELDQGHKEASAQSEMTKQLLEVNRNLERTLNELNRRNQEISWLKEFSSSLQTCFYIEETYQLIEQYITKLLAETFGVLYLMHSSHNYLESVLSWGDLFVAEKIIKPDECFALRRGSIYKINNAPHDLLCPHNLSRHLSSYMCIPLFAQSDIIGLFTLEWKNNHNNVYFDKESQDALASMFAEQIALSISNIKFRETLRNQSFRDTLTGLFNRRYIEETLEREISRCHRKSGSLAILMIDIDHFKQFNDEFGHEAGDLIIQSFANVLRNFSKKEEITCRYGGDEFIYVIPETTMKATIQKAQALHEAVDNIHLRYGGNPLPQITISIGVAMYPKHGEKMAELITASDVALYQAKNSGRNNTVFYK
jgi:diguanylate cyclase (GGDEF)-like protein